MKCCLCVSFKTVLLQDETKLERVTLCVPATDSYWILGNKLNLRQNNSKMQYDSQVARTNSFALQSAPIVPVCLLM